MGTVRVSKTNSSPSTRFMVEGDLLSQSASGNYSVVRCYLVAVNEGNTTSEFLNSGYQAGTIAGVKEFGRKTAQPFLPGGYANGQTRWRLGPYDVRVDHDSDGTREPIRFGMVLSYAGTETLFSDPMSLPKISRASTPWFSPGNSFDAGTEIDIRTGRASAEYTHDITWHFQGLTGTVGTALPGNYLWTPPLSMLAGIPNATSGPGHIKTVTKNGSIVIGETTTSFTLRAPASVKPTVSGVTVADQNSTVASVVGRIVQGLSLVSFTVNGAGAHGSTITGSEVTFQGETVSAGSAVQVTGSGSLPIAARVTDSRGREGAGTATVPVLAYSPPSVTAYQARRCTSAGVLNDDGVHLRVDLNATIASLINGTERNVLDIRAFTRVRGTTTWTPRNVVTPGGTSYNTWFLVTGGGIFTTLTSYDVRVEVRDKFGVYVADTAVSTATVTLDLSGTKVGVGKVHEIADAALDVAGNVYAGGVLLVGTNYGATDVRAGLVERATQAEADAGTDTTRYVSPKSLRDRAYAPFSMASGSGSVDAPGSSGAEVAVTFPSGRFTVAPNLMVTMGPANDYFGGRTESVRARSATGFTFGVSNTSAAAITVPFMWMAMQMTGSAANG